MLYDGRLPGEMTLDGIAKRLDAIDARLGGVEAKVGGLEAEMRSGFTRVDEKLNEAKIRDEELHGLLLKDVLRHVTAARAKG